jgi:hypothetical protein
MLAAPHAHPIHDYRVAVVNGPLHHDVFVALEAVGKSAHQQDVVVIGGVLFDKVEERERRAT